MKILFCDFLNYISHCVFLISKAIKQTVFVVCTVKAKIFLNIMPFLHKL